MAIDVKLIKELRNATGAGVLDAKKALESSNGDYEQAMRYLREKGLARAAKRANRETTEGRVEGRVADHKSGLLLEVNCETDFVGRNDAFIGFAQDLTDFLFENSREGQSLDELMSLKTADGLDSAELLQALISSTGENMSVRRFVRYDLGDHVGMVEVYIHPGNRVAVMLELDCTNTATAESDAFRDLAHDLALHIAAQAPLCRTQDEIPAEKLAAEKETYRQRALNEGKPENIVDRIIEGRLRKYFEEVVLFSQPFVKDDEITVGDLMKKRSAELGEELALSRFVRFELGEPLD